MSRYAPISSEERRELREAADDLGITVDELERRMSADLDERHAERAAADGPRWVPRPPAKPEQFKLDDATIELGRSKLAELRAKLNQPQETQPTEEVTE